MNKSERKLIKGRLEVQAVRDTRRGLSDGLVPAGTIGYVLGGGPHTKARDLMIFWPSLPKQYASDNRLSAHPQADITPTGKRG